MYYNKSTKETLSIAKLSAILNASIPKNTESVNNEWFLIHNSEMPECDDQHRIVEGGVKLIDGKYTRCYKLETLSDKELQEKKSQAKQEQLSQAKNARSEAVSNISIEVDGMVFDGDEKSQDRMSRAIVAAAGDNSKVVSWILADDSVAKVTIGQLLQALVKSTEEQTKLWTVPYSK